MNLHIINGLMEENTIIISDEHKNTIIIDPGASFDKIENYIDSNELNLQAVLLTHAHYDHMYSILEIKDKYNPEVVCGEGEEIILENDKYNFSTLSIGKKIELSPDKVVKDNDILKYGDLQFKVLHTPGHTPGGITFYIDNILIAGDAVFYGSYGRTDFPYSSTEDLIYAIKNKILKYPDDTVIYSGHGRSTTEGFKKIKHYIK